MPARGLLENDIVLTRFLDRFEQELTDAQVAGFTRLLDEPDNVLLDLILGRTEPHGELAREDGRRVLAMIRSA